MIETIIQLVVYFGIVLVGSVQFIRKRLKIMRYFKVIFIYTARLLGIIGVLGIPTIIWLSLTLPLNIVQFMMVLLFVIPCIMLIMVAMISFDRHLHY